MRYQPEAMITIQATANEVIALNALITQYLRSTQADTDLHQLLRQFQHRLVAHLPQRPAQPLE